MSSNENGMRLVEEGMVTVFHFLFVFKLYLVLIRLAFGHK